MTIDAIDSGYKSREEDDKGRISMILSHFRTIRNS